MKIFPLIPEFKCNGGLKLHIMHETKSRSLKYKRDKKAKAKAPAVPSSLLTGKSRHFAHFRMLPFLVRFKAVIAS